jgi:DNA gyrase inhibitor GyrI
MLIGRSTRVPGARAATARRSAMVTSQGQEIEVRRLPAGQVAYQTFRGTVPSIESVTSSVRSWVVTMGFQPQGPMAVEILGTPTDEPGTEFDIEVQLPVGENAKAHPSDKVQIKPFMETDAVVMTLRGPYELTGITAPLEEMRRWVQEKGMPPSDVVRWVEVTDPAKVSPQDQITEVQYLVNR